MSIFSKIFIVLNLALTVLLVAAISAQVNLKGVYKKSYEDHHKEWRGVREKLNTTKGNYQEQLAAHKKQLADQKTVLAERTGAHAESRKVLAERGKQMDGLHKSKNELKNAIQELETQSTALAGQIKSTEDQVEAARKEGTAAANRTQQAVLTLHDKRQLAAELKAMLDAIKGGE